MSWLERAIAYVSPERALRRQEHRAALQRLYDAASSSPRRRQPTDRRSADAVLDHSSWKLAAWARHLEQNLDLASGLLDALSAQAAAITIEPQIRRRTGELHEEAIRATQDLWETQREAMEVTGGYGWVELLQLLARSWLRDGEVLIHHLERSPVVGMYPTPVPYQIQALEIDYLPWDATVSSPRLVHGVELDGLGRPQRYHLYRDHPGAALMSTAVTVSLQDLIPVPARNLTHLRRVSRFGQTRGVTCFASTITRWSDLKHYEESERIAAEVTSNVCLAITRPDAATPITSIDSSTKERRWTMQPGVVFDGMLPGERIDLLNPSRPNPQAADWRATQLRAAAAGAGASYSTLARDYAGTYSSQRQELVEHIFQVRRRLQAPLIATVLRPIWKRFVRNAVLENLIPLVGADPMTITDARYNGIAVPWIDMLKEAQAERELIAGGLKSRHQSIREHDGDPHRVDDELEADTFTPAAPPSPATDEDSDDAVAA